MEERQKQTNKRNNVNGKDEASSKPIASPQIENYSSSASLLEHQENSSEVILLVLDESLHRIPWESFPFLSETIVCRLPSLPFAVALC